MQILPRVHVVELIRAECSHVQGVTDTEFVLLDERGVDRDGVRRPEVLQRPVQQLDRGINRAGIHDGAVDPVVRRDRAVVVDEREIRLRVRACDTGNRFDRGLLQAAIGREDGGGVRDRLGVVTSDHRRRASGARDERDRGTADERDEERDDNQCAPPLPELRSRDEAHRTEHVRR